MLISPKVVFDGLVLTAPHGAWVVDSIHPGRDQHSVLVLLAGWHRDVGDHDGFLILPEGLVRRGRYYRVGAGSQYDLATIEELSDPVLTAAFQQVQTVWDTRRGDYEVALHRMAGLMRGYLLGPWRKAIKSRPYGDAASIRLSHLAGNREVGSILVRNEYDGVVDALVIDEYKQSATALADSRLRPYADLWEKTQLTVSEFIDWLIGQPLYNGWNWTQPKAGVRNGHIEKIALASVAS